MKTLENVQQQCRNAALEKNTVSQKLDGEVSHTSFIICYLTLMGFDYLYYFACNYINYLICLNKGTPFWEIGAPMQYYISKKCATEEECVTTISKYMPNCQRIWWRDWKCAECCKGDRCNYFITVS